MNGDPIAARKVSQGIGSTTGGLSAAFPTGKSWLKRAQVKDISRKLQKSLNRVRVMVQMSLQMLSWGPLKINYMTHGRLTQAPEEAMLNKDESRTQVMFKKSRARKQKQNARLDQHHRRKTQEEIAAKEKIEAGILNEDIQMTKRFRSDLDGDLGPVKKARSSTNAAGTDDLNTRAITPERTLSPDSNAAVDVVEKCKAALHDKLKDPKI
ncbi:MAG: hypothetical protein Q9172_004239 [Xanthocarpia lactea]